MLEGSLSVTFWKLKRHGNQGGVLYAIRGESSLQLVTLKLILVDVKNVFGED